ncbi:endonuclease MutS2 isoform X4 [Benincasa hispida]|uniref:endonuclease MutS2 isoform X4 n=1 Tax=Benincasa hispida TaxID=102211 RepID=UPI0018FF5856|nr:endonuclease MutS2 isoform X4 [Benincasa hispida]
MLCAALFGHPLTWTWTWTNSSTLPVPVKFQHRAASVHLSLSANIPVGSDIRDNRTQHSVHLDSLRALEWDKLCDSVASFTRTSLGRQAIKAQLWSSNWTYEESLRLLDETNAAVEMHKHGGCSLDLSGVNLHLVKSAIEHAQRSLPMDGNEAIAIAALLQFADMLQFNLKTAIKEDADWSARFMPLTKVIMGMLVNQSLIKLILNAVDEDGSVKDSASYALRESRDQVRKLEKKLHQLMDSLVRNAKSGTSFLEVEIVDGRWCIKSEGDQLMDVKGLLLSSDTGTGFILEPLSAVPLNDELQQARASVAKAEEDVLFMLTEKVWVKMDFEDINKLIGCIIELDVAEWYMLAISSLEISLPRFVRCEALVNMLATCCWDDTYLKLMVNARASYGLSFGGTCPNLILPEGCNSSIANVCLSGDQTSEASHSKKNEWVLYLQNAHHPLLLQQYRENLENAKRDVQNAFTEMGRKLPGGNMSWKEKEVVDISLLKMKVEQLEKARPVSVDFSISRRIQVLVITGPNTGGKTVCLKTIGLAAMMAKSGLHVLASESAQIPWFDSIFADIGDEQSLTQSLSTFSGHLRKISDIQSVSTSRSLVLLDEVGAGTNPLEGAALGMSLLESFAKSGAALTVATTHHGELKTLKYSNEVFENACMEFDEVNLKPTYKILWGVPGRSNAINIAERLGLPSSVVDDARELYGAGSAKIDEVITNMECIKKKYGDLLQEAQNNLTLHEKLLLARRNIIEHGKRQRLRKVQEVIKAATRARSNIHQKVRELRASPIEYSPPSATDSRQRGGINSNNRTTAGKKNLMALHAHISSTSDISQPRSEEPKFPTVGDTVYVSSFGKKATVLGVEPSKDEVIVQVGSIKLKVKFTDIMR